MFRNRAQKDIVSDPGILNIGSPKPARASRERWQDVEVFPATVHIRKANAILPAILEACKILEMAEIALRPARNGW
jgi:hypothetical protein